MPLPCSGRGGGCGGGWCGGCCCGGCGASESLSSASKIPIILYDLMAFVSEPGKKTSGLQFVGSAGSFLTIEKLSFHKGSYHFSHRSCTCHLHN